MSPPAPLRLELFGAVRLLEDGAPMRVSLKRAHALLAYLALEGRPVPRDHLALLLWPEASQEIGRTRLRRLVYTVEEQCGRELFEAVGSTLALSAHALDCDVAEFRRIAHDLVGGGSPGITLRQLDEWAGRACEPLMEGLGFGSDEFDDWLSATRTSHQHLLQRTLSRLAQLHRARGASGAAVAACEQLIRMDAFAEPAYVLRMQLAADLHDVGGVESAFERCAQALRAEYGCKPSRETEAAYLRARELAAGPGTEAPSMRPPELDIRFAPGPQGSVAYALIGQGSEALVVMPGFISHIEIGWEHPGTRAVLGELARHFTVVVFDRRGLGLSERLEATGTAKAAAADVLTILDHASIRKAWLFGSSEGGPAAIELAAARPDRVSGLLLFGAMAKGSRVPDYPWAMDAAAYNAWMNIKPSEVSLVPVSADAVDFHRIARDEIEKCRADGEDRANTRIRLRKAFDPYVATGKYEIDWCNVERDPTPNKSSYRATVGITASGKPDEDGDTPLITVTIPITDPWW